MILQSEPSMSIRRLTSGEYESNEMTPISLTTPLGRAIVNEEWLNMEPSQQEYWLRELSSLHVEYAGTIISSVRKQVELTLIYRDTALNHGHQVSFCITLADFERFLY